MLARFQRNDPLAAHPDGICPASRSTASPIAYAYRLRVTEAIGRRDLILCPTSSWIFGPAHLAPFFFRHPRMSVFQGKGCLIL